MGARGGGGGTYDIINNIIIIISYNYNAAQSWKPLPYFRPKYTTFHTLFQTRLSKCIPYFRQCEVWLFQQLSMDIRRTGFGDAPNWCTRVFFSSRSMSTATHVTLKMVSHTKQTEYAPYFRPKWEKSIPYFRLEMLENGTLWGGTYLYGLKYVNSPLHRFTQWNLWSKRKTMETFPFVDLPGRLLGRDWRASAFREDLQQLCCLVISAASSNLSQYPCSVRFEIALVFTSPRACWPAST